MRDEDVRRCLGDGRQREAFELLLERYSQKVFHLAWSMVRDQTLAEDMTQETFMKIWRGLPGFQGEAALSTWIYTIARNTCLTEIRRRATRQTVSLETPEFEDGLDQVAAPDTAEPHAGVEMDVHELLGRLPEKYRQVITLYYLEQRSYEEVAGLLGIPLGTVKTFLYRAKRELLRLTSRSPARGALQHH